METKKCSRCNEVFKTTIELGRHEADLRLCEPYPCQYCSTIFPKRDLLVQHQKICLRSFCEVCHKKGHIAMRCPENEWGWSSWIIRIVITIIMIAAITASITTFSKGVNKKYCDDCSEESVNEGKGMVMGSYIFVGIMDILATIVVGYSCYHNGKHFREYLALCSVKCVKCCPEKNTDPFAFQCDQFFWTPVFGPIYLILCLCSMIVFIAFAWPPGENIMNLGKKADVGILTTLHLQLICGMYLIWTLWVKVYKHEDPLTQSVKVVPV